MSCSPQPTAGPAVVLPSPKLAAQLRRLRRRHLLTAAGTGLALWIVVGLELLALGLFVDWWWDLPWGGRLALLLGHLTVAGYILGRFVLRPLVRCPTDDALALMVERAYPQLGGRLIASVQLTRPGALAHGASAALAQAVVAQTETMVGPLDLGQIVSSDKLRRLGLAAGIVGLLAGAVLVGGGPEVRVLLRRAFLSAEPVPRKTRVLVRDGHKLIGRGDSVRLEALALGLVPARGKLEVQWHSGRQQTFSLEPTRTNRALFVGTLDNVQESFDYVIYLNDGRSDRFRVRAVPRPTVVSVHCEQHFPPYTGLPPMRRLPGDLTLLAGSVLHLTVLASKDIQQAALRLVGPGPNRTDASGLQPDRSPNPQGANRQPASSATEPTAAIPTPAGSASPGLEQSPPTQGDTDGAGASAGSELPLQVNPTNRRELTGQIRIPARGLSGFWVWMQDTEGMDSRDPAVYRIEVLPDRPPTVRLTYPERKEELYTRQARVLIGFEASDDFALAKVRLCYTIDTPEPHAVRSIELDLGDQQPARLRRRYEWNLADFNPLLPEGTRLEYWIEVQDNNDVTGPGVGVSDHQFARLVSAADKLADLLNRAGDYLGSVSDLAADQQKANQALGALIREKVRAP